MSVLAIDAFIVVTWLGSGSPTRFPIVVCSHVHEDQWIIASGKYSKRTGIRPGPGQLVYLCGQESILKNMPGDAGDFYRRSVPLDVPLHVPSAPVVDLDANGAHCLLLPVATSSGSSQEKQRKVCFPASMKPTDFIIWQQSYTEPLPFRLRVRVLRERLAAVFEKALGIDEWFERKR